MIILPPKIDRRTFSRLAEAILAMAPHYTPEWKAEEKEAGTALTKIHAFITEMIITRLNEVPRKSLIAFLDMLGIKLLPAQPSRVPVVFKLAQGTPADILVPSRTQASAAKTEAHDEVPFETEENLLAVTAGLKEVISVDPAADAIYVHTENIVAADGSVKDRQEAFTLFAGRDQQEHSLYLGHKDLLNIKGRGEIRLSVSLPPAAGNASPDVLWEYWGEDKEEKTDRWISLEVKSDGTDGFRQNGEIVLFKGLDGEIREAKLKDIFSATGRAAIKNPVIAGMNNRWIRVNLKTKLSGDLCCRFPVLDTVFLRTSPAEPVQIDVGFFNDVALDYTKKQIRGERMEKATTLPKQQFAAVFPFGTQPKLYDAFYVGNKEVFSKKGAKISLSLLLSIVSPSAGTTTPEPRLAWEYWDGKGWQALTIDRDDSHSFVNASSDSGDVKIIAFVCPQGIEETEVFGQKNFWIRARIIGGDYGREQYVLGEDNTINVMRMFKLPVIRDLTVRYVFDEGLELEACLSHNNLDFEDRTAESKKTGLTFSPFIALPDAEKAVYLGFDKQPVGGPVRIFFAAGELSYKEEDKPEVQWQYRAGGSWSVLDCLDETEGFAVQGILDFIGPAGFAAQSIFDRSLYWLRGALVRGLYESPPNLAGVFPNATWTVQAETIREEIIGSSDGQPGQAFTFFKFPVVEGEEVRVKELLSEEERQMLVGTYGETVIAERTVEAGEASETWILWSEAADFFQSTGKSRHYTIDRATGQIAFGDGVHGMIPPVGENNVKAFSYRTGGGRKGNVKAGEITSLTTAVSGIEKVMNPIAADGGADTATVDEMIEIGPAVISTRNRAVTAEDYEWLAREASRKVVRARCLPNRNREGHAETGWVTVVVVPESAEEKPCPTVLLKKQVQEYLERHSLGTIASPGHLHVDGPTYVPMNVSVDLFVTSIDAASPALREAKQQLAAFFHPLTGGPEGEGWEFGRGVAASDVFALLERIRDVDHVENLDFQGFEKQDFITVPPNALVANGEHTVNVHLTGGA